jgi:hypothetical protein
LFSVADSPFSELRFVGTVGKLQQPFALSTLDGLPDSCQEVQTRPAKALRLW